MDIWDNIVLDFRFIVKLYSTLIFTYELVNLMHVYNIYLIIFCDFYHIHLLHDILCFYKET